MKRVLAALILLINIPQSATAETPLNCPTNEKLAEEILDIQVAGLRVPLASASCLDPARFKHVRVSPPHVSETKKMPAPKFVNEAKPYEIKSIKKTDDGRFEVKVVFFVEKDGKAVPIEDGFLFTRWENESNRVLGCATVVVQPRTPVIRKSCYNP